jgi:D-aminopeptidase
MSSIAGSRLSATIQALPDQYKGPGGVVAVVKNGEAIVRHAWGYADTERQVPMSARTAMPICSLTKQFTCAVLLDTVGDPAKLAPALANYLGQFVDERPSIQHLCNNQSGLRDYCILASLCGVDPEGRFGKLDAWKLLSGMRSTHFTPGSQYSYANSNFRILADLIQDYTGRSLGELLAAHIFGPVGMDSATFQPDSREYGATCTGYDGSYATGWIPAVNRSYWSGDAGICASLDDMIAWERFIDATRGEPGGLYQRLAVPQTYSNGDSATYGNGLFHGVVAGVPITGHGGSIRGWRIRRSYAASERLSVVVMFNHHGDAHGAADLVMAAALNREEPNYGEVTPESNPTRHYLDEATGLSLSLTPVQGDRITARFLDTPEVLTIGHEGVARSDSEVITIAAGAVIIERPTEGLRLSMRELHNQWQADIEGRFHCSEIDAYLICVSKGGAMFGTFEGFLGKSPAQPMYAVGKDVWLLPCQRGLDSPGPGDLTLAFKRDGQGTVSGLTISCWMARTVKYTRS